MSKYFHDINNYGKDVDDILVSPFESIQMLHDRSYLQSMYHELTLEEQILLSEYDLKLIKNAKNMVKHIEKVYDFSLSSESTEEWWWHLDKIADGTIPFGVSSLAHGKVI
ncbi:hypothetical protein ELQ35_17485 [Peribacillus cavernae]|uniref:Uncharacterized protein n=1 Tax=Peribacillus cavernae TaxID=1674310 RepID=A0A3S0W3W4_9BACI|nr:hypothetical protein [Peribacillus cavernae]MDQ0219433.1 hypothetical protein [Peribacillus cavernae]RUQ27141.1 hypothetical protein ELQ35_17485 [Peribacillus cavernae]